jgi:hypothetical protein
VELILERNVAKIKIVHPRVERHARLEHGGLFEAPRATTCSTDVKSEVIADDGNVIVPYVHNCQDVSFSDG